MSTELCELKRDELNLLLKIIEKLYSSHDRDTLRERIAEDLLRLLKADYLASFIWNPRNEMFEHVLFLNMTHDGPRRVSESHHEP